MRILTATSLPLSGAGETLARNLIARLDSTYPAFAGAWRVHVNEQGGIVEITNVRLSGRMGFTLHLNKLDPEGRKVVRAAGELLERYRVTRAKAFDVRDLVLQRDRRGDFVHD